jgi:hypothetical protein
MPKILCSPLLFVFFAAPVPPFAARLGRSSRHHIDRSVIRRAFSILFWTFAKSCFEQTTSGAVVEVNAAGRAWFFILSTSVLWGCPLPCHDLGQITADHENPAAAGTTRRCHACSAGIELNPLPTAPPNAAARYSTRSSHGRLDG